MKRSIYFLIISFVLACLSFRAQAEGGVNGYGEGQENSSYDSAIPNYNVKDDSLYGSLKGKIILKVESNGEAYYVHPVNQELYFLSRPENAFRVMREQGIGISNENLNKIPIQFEGLGSSDSDLDGLHDFIEEAYGTNPNKKDTDGDGYDDGTEVKNGYNPNGSGRLGIDQAFANKQKGKIFLQVEQSGEAWYVNPVDGMRYYLGRPADAFIIMRNLGLGISNVNFSRMVDDSVSKNTATADEQGTVSGLSSAAKECWDVYNDSEKTQSDLIVKDMCVKRIAKEKVNIEICEELEIEKMSCYEDVAELANRIDYCDKGTNPSGQCYYKVARNVGDENICSNLDEQYKKDSCYLGVATKNGNSKLCEMIKDISKINDCYAHVAYVAEDASYCISMQKEELKGWHSRDYCYINVMKLTGDYELCEQVTGEGVGPAHDKQYCYKTAVGVTSDIEICSRLNDSDFESKDMCYYAIANSQQDAAICDRISNNNTTLMQQCIEANS